jgi:KDO2-lipid IV(A) lauroyltransferase
VVEAAPTKASPADRLTVLTYRAGARAAAALPESAAATSASFLGPVVSQAMKGRRSTVERHLRRVRGDSISSDDVRRGVKAAFESYARYWIESFRLPYLTAAEIDRQFSYSGVDHLEDALCAGNGVILALPHLGGWEWAGRWCIERGMKLTVVVEPLNPPELFEWFVSFRRSLGMNVVPLGPEAGRVVLKALRNNEVVCLLCDRDIGGGGIEVDFFGERTKIPGGPATLSLRTGAALLPTAVYFDGPYNHRGLVRPPLNVERNGKTRVEVTQLTQMLAHELEGLVRRAPEQWHLFQPNWPSDPGYGE